MRNYVIINEINSNTIQGLAINILPPITKPMMRSQIEEIDGRDGDLVTELGYSAYDKTMEIGLWGTYDIDAIIKYFTGEGTIVFSTEPDKYYYFKILNQIDYEKLLKFKKATVTFHCQPYKYPTSETPLEEAYEYVEATGTDLTLNNTEETIFNKFDLIGNTYQDSTTGKNLANIYVIPNQTSNLTLTIANDKITISNNGNTAGYTNTQTKLKDLCPSLQVGDVAYLFFDTTSLVASKNIIYIGETWTKNSSKTITQTMLDANVALYGGYQETAVISNFMITKVNDSTYEPYTGGIPSPNPNYPQDIHVVSGDNTVTVCGKNLLDTSSMVMGDLQNDTGAEIVNNNHTHYRSGFIKVLPSTQYTFTTNYTYPRNSVTKLMEYNNDKTFIQRSPSSSPNKTITFTTTSTTQYLRICMYSYSAFTDFYSLENMLCKGNNTTYEAYTGATYLVNLGTMELCKIGTYQDYIYKDNGSWYLHKEIGKIVLDGSEGWGYDSTYKYFRSNTYDFGTQIPLNGTSGLVQYSDYFNLIIPWNSFRDGTTTNGFYWVQNSGYKLAFRNTNYTLTADFTDWLSQVKPSVYFPLATPIDIPIEDTTLIEQLEALKLANSYEGQTNISQTNNDMPLILDLSALKENSDHLVIDNIGNIYSKPTLDLEGTGIVDIYLNDEQIFEIDMTTQNEIIIDTEKMEAYTPDNILANRLVTGDYSNFKLAPGENDLRFSGDLTKATITRYIRWI